MPEQKNLKSALVIGASRGLGLGLVKAFTQRGWNVTATVRKSPEAGVFDDGVTLETLDINDAESVASFLPALKSKVFDVVFINAGIGGAPGKTPETATPQEIAEIFTTNAVSPISLAAKLLLNVKADIGILAFMSSVLGSVAVNAGESKSLYSASKAALNRLTRSFVVALEENITVLSLHPGWVKTELGGENAPVDVATSVQGLVDVLDAKAGSHVHEYLDYQGKTIPW